MSSSLTLERGGGGRWGEELFGVYLFFFFFCYFLMS